MLKLLLSAACLAATFSSPAFAGTVTCNASTLGFDITITGKYAGDRAAGPGYVVVSRNGKVERTLVLNPESSSIRLNDHIDFSGVSQEGRGAVTTKFKAGAYSGTLRASIFGLPIYTGIRCRI